MKYDVHIVGAGISGCIAARELARKGLSVIVTEEDPKIGLPEHCTGVVSVRGLNETGVDYKDTILNELHGSTIYGPNKEEILVNRKAVQAYVIDRPKLDSVCAGKAMDAGAGRFRKVRSEVDRCDHSILLYLQVLRREAVRVAYDQQVFQGISRGEGPADECLPADRLVVRVFASLLLQSGTAPV